MLSSIKYNHKNQSIAMCDSNYIGDNGELILGYVTDFLIALMNDMIGHKFPIPEKLLLTMIRNNMIMFYNLRHVCKHIDNIIIEKFLPILSIGLSVSNATSLYYLINNSLIREKFVRGLKYVITDTNTINQLKIKNIFFRNTDNHDIDGSVRFNSVNFTRFELNASTYVCYTNFMVDSMFDIFPGIKYVRCLSIKFARCMINLEDYINQFAFLEKLELRGYNIKFSDGYKLNPSIKYISFDKYNKPDIHKIFNDTLIFISLEEYNYPLPKLPPNLQQLLLVLYNHAHIENILPCTLKSLLLIAYNHQIIKKLPESITRLALGHYNHPNIEYILPNNLKYIDLNWYNNELKFLPDAVTYILLNSYNHDKVEYILPLNIKHLHLVDYNHPFTRRLPKSITTLILNDYNQPDISPILPEGLISLLSNSYTNQIDFLPETLRYLKLNEYNQPNIDNIIPYNIGRIHLPKYNHPFKSDYIFPESLLALNIKSYNFVGIENALPYKLNYLNIKRYTHRITHSKLPESLLVMKCHFSNTLENTE